MTNNYLNLVKNNGANLSSIPMEERTFEICLTAAIDSEFALQDTPAKFKTDEFWMELILKANWQGVNEYVSQMDKGFWKKFIYNYPSEDELIPEDMLMDVLIDFISEDFNFFYEIVTNNYIIDCISMPDILLNAIKKQLESRNASMYKLISNYLFYFVTFDTTFSEIENSELWAYVCENTEVNLYGYLPDRYLDIDRAVAYITCGDTDTSPCDKIFDIFDKNIEFYAKLIAKDIKWVKYLENYYVGVGGDMQNVYIYGIIYKLFTFDYIKFESLNDTRRIALIIDSANIDSVIEAIEEDFITFDNFSDWTEKEIKDWIAEYKRLFSVYPKESYSTAQIEKLKKLKIF